MCLETVGMVLGYHLTLKKARKRARRLSRIRGIAAGVTTPLIAGVTLAMIPVSLRFMLGTASVFALAMAGCFAAGAFMAASMFVRRKRPELEASEVAGELPGESLESWFKRMERRADELVKRFRSRSGWRRPRPHPPAGVETRFS